VAKFIWVASYPRSGNTWLRFLIANLLIKPIESSAELNEVIPGIHRGVRAIHLFGNRTTFIKTHWAWRPDLPLREDVIGAIYIVRNPLDVAVSNANYRLLGAGERVAGMPEAERAAFQARLIDEFIAEGGDPAWRQQGMGSWDENVRSWLAKSNPVPRLVLRYEDLKDDASRQAADICRFFKLSKSPEEIAQAVERSSFRALRAMEEREIAAKQEGFFYDRQRSGAMDAGVRFINQGEAGAGAAQLSEAQRQAALERFGPTMRIAGYLERGAEPQTAAG
jgi:hypothetical protein